MTEVKKVNCHRCGRYFAKRVCASCNKPVCLNCTYNLIIEFRYEDKMRSSSVKWEVCFECYTLRKSESTKCNLQPELYYLN